MEVEDTFGITIEDEEAARVRTVGELRDVVLSKVKRDGARACLTSQVFYRLRGAIQGTLGKPRRAVRPNTELDKLVSREGRRETWADLAQAADLVLPALRRPAWFRWLVGLGMFATMFAATHGLIIHRLTLIQVVGFIVLASLAFLWFILILTRPLATSFAGATVATVVQQIVADDLKLLTAGREPPWSEDEVWDVLQTVVCNQLAASRQQVTPQARFVEDLGMY